MNSLNIILQKIRFAWSLLWSKTYIISLDNKSVVQIPLIDITSIENSFILNAQAASLRVFRDKLGDLIDEHDQAIQLLAHREKNAKKSSSNSKKSTATSRKRR